MKLEKNLFTVRVARGFLKLFIICGIFTPFILTSCNNDEPTPEPFNFTMNVKLLLESEAFVAPDPSGIETREIGKTDVEYIQVSVSEPPRQNSEYRL